ncbi:SulP family inorganic anion transporter [Motiliproteus sediminis]|uniref:SulP family inorganic anion transporter n=1 Tax=Motiliproteus sediminis TaxID=1468178 RepID=UPI001AEF63E0|nr:SulP family inorganic anion transporter [Motiliproteus sediminis]
MLLIHGLHFNNLRGDLFGGLTAAIVALPLALAFGVSSGIGPVAGLFGAICVGLFAALFGGTPAQVSGPTGPMTVVMAAVFTDFVSRDPQAGPLLAFTVVLLAGGFQILFGLMKLGKYVTLVPFPVISGFMTGIGVIIILLQLGPLLGQPAIGGVVASIEAIPAEVSHLNPIALLLGALTLATVVFWPKRLSSFVPPSLAALVIATLMALVIPGHESLPVIGTIPSGLPQLHLPLVDTELLQEMLTAALMLAALGAIDSLLTSLVADNLSKTQHDSDRELIGQGVGNVVAGLAGGLPGAGATMRTVVNIRAGGKTPLSGAVHALVLLLIVLGAGTLAESIPHCVLAGILIKVGLDIIDWGFLRRVHRAPPFVALLMFLVLGLTVFVDLITAVGVGVFLANMYTVKRLSDVQVDAVEALADDDQTLSEAEREQLAAAGGRVVLYHFNGPVSFGAAKGIQKKLASARSHDKLLLDFSAVPYVDVSTALALEELIIDSRRSGADVYLVGLQATVEGVLRRMRVLRRLPEHHILADRPTAIAHACRAIVQVA